MSWKRFSIAHSYSARLAVDALDVVRREAADGPNRSVTILFEQRGDESGRSSLSKFRTLSALGSTPATLHAIDATA
jgi:hypothetical protein